MSKKAEKNERKVKQRRRNNGYQKRKKMIK